MFIKSNLETEEISNILKSADAIAIEAQSEIVNKLKHHGEIANKIFIIMGPLCILISILSLIADKENIARFLQALFYFLVFFLVSKRMVYVGKNFPFISSRYEIKNTITTIEVNDEFFRKIRRAVVGEEFLTIEWGYKNIFILKKKGNNPDFEKLSDLLILKKKQNYKFLLLQKETI